MQPLLPLPFLRTGTLLAASPLAGSLQERCAGPLPLSRMPSVDGRLTPALRWAADSFVVDHESFRAASAAAPEAGAAQACWCACSTHVSRCRQLQGPS